ncbi:MAG: tRNA (adenosine(37)-N6)-threonylcarbamoyltransferase complex transferase subunit TsaD [Fusobacteriota bacterium]
MKILAIETSCDETSIAVVEDGKKVLSNIISSQVEIHREYGGVVPEIASRHHIKNIMPILEESLSDAKLTLEDMDYIAVTYAPGLIGALLVGISVAKSLSYGSDIPLIPVHHLRGHIYSNFIENDVDLPALALVVSGGHTNIVKIDEKYNFYNIGETLDDAVGEAFDKVGRVLGLPYPGGPIIDKLYYDGDPFSIDITKPKVDGKYDFSFSGVKTNIINYVNTMKMKKEEFKKEDLAASFQRTVVEILTEKIDLAAKDMEINNILLAGGVAANSFLRSKMKELSKKRGYKLSYPSLKLCTDNAAMIGTAAYYKIKYHGIGDLNNINLNGVPNLSIEN